MPERTAMELLREYWAIAAGFVAVIVWAVRLESGMKNNSDQIKSLWRQRNEDIDAHRQAREETNKMLDEIRQDIKALLQRGA